jgi:hypothetical protein
MDQIPSMKCKHTWSGRQEAVMTTFVPVSSPVVPSRPTAFEGKLAGVLQHPTSLFSEVQLGLASRTASEAGDFSCFFDGIQLLRATLIFSQNAQIVFDKAQWSPQKKILTADTTFNVFNKPVTIRFTCDTSKSESWSCQYKTSLRETTVLFQLNPGLRTDIVVPNPEFAFTYNYIEKKGRIKLKLVSKTNTRDEELSEIFAHTKILRAIVSFADAIFIAFENAEWQLDDTDLHAKQDFARDGQTYQIVMDCRFSVIPDKLSCTYLSGLNGMYHEFDFSRVK